MSQDDEVFFDASRLTVTGWCLTGFTTFGAIALVAWYFVFAEGSLPDSGIGEKVLVGAGLIGIFAFFFVGKVVLEKVELPVFHPEEDDE